MSNVAVRAFRSGVLAPALRAQTSLAKYAEGLADSLNGLVMKTGGWQNRPGTAYVGETAGDVDAPVRLIEFVRSDAEAYVLEFSDRLMRVYRDGAPLTVTNDVTPATDAYVEPGYAYVASAPHVYVATTAFTNTFPILYLPPFGANWRDYWRYLGASAAYEAATPYAAADLADLKVVQSGDVMTIAHPSYPLHELRRNGENYWTFTAVAIGPAIGTPEGFTVGSGDLGTRYYAVAAVAEDGEEGLPTAVVTDANSLPATSNPVVLAWDPVPGALRYRVYRGETPTALGFIGTGGGLPLDQSDTSWTTATSTASTSTASTWVAAATQARNALTLAALGDKAYDEQYTITGKLSVSATGGPPVMTEGRIRVYYSRDGEARIDSGTLVTGSQFRAYGATTMGPIPFTAVVRVPDNGYAALTIDLVPEVYGTPNSGSPTYSAAVDMTDPGYDVVAWKSNGVGFSDDGSAVADYLDTPRVNRAAFGAPGAYPGAVTLYQQRRVVAASSDEPEMTWASRTAFLDNFTVSGILRDDDAVVWRLVGRRVNEVRHLVDFDDLLQLTAGGVHAVRGNEAGVLTPAGINPRQVSSVGAAASGQLAPIVAGDTLLYVQARGAAVRALAPTSSGGYGGTDVTVFASHLFSGYTVVDWAWQETPDPTLWAVRSDGALLGCTYLPEYDVLAWHRHAIAGGASGDAVVENVCCVPEGDEDALYLAVRRTLDGAEARSVERMGTRTLRAAPTDATEPDDDPRVIDAVGFVDAAVVADAWTDVAAGATLTLTGASYAAGASLTLTASAFTPFVVGDVGRTLVLESEDGDRVRLLVTAYTSATVVTVEPEAPVPSALQAASAARWAWGATTVTGLDHLEGESVAVVADGEVVANPLDDTVIAITVSGGAVTLPRAYAHVRVGLAYASELETLDIDVAGGSSRKPETNVAVRRVGVQVLRTRSLRVGTDDAHLAEVVMRTTSDWSGLPPLATGYYEAGVSSGPTSHGRVLLRTTQPLPCTVLAIHPVF